MRLAQSVTGGATVRMAYDGLDRIAEYDAVGALQRRYVHGPGDDEPIVWYEGSGTSDRRFLGSDERGSIISVTDSAGAVLGLNRYDEYGQPQSTNIGTFGYTGQAWLPGANLWHYKARAYDPELGQFLQTDPIGYEGGVNLYAYVGNDPVNLVDPLGLASGCPVNACVIGWHSRASDGISLIALGALTNAIGRGTPSANRQQEDITQDVTVRGKRSKKIRAQRPATTARSQRLTACQIANVRQLYGEAFITDQLEQVTFTDMWTIDPMGATAYSSLTASMAHRNGNPAITRGNTVYVNPDRWQSIVNPNRAVFWEEIAHTLQYRENTLSVVQYALAVGMAWAAGLEGHDNHIEIQAGDLMGEELLRNWKSGNAC